MTSDEDFKKELSRLHISQKRKIYKIKGLRWESDHKYSDNFTESFKKRVKDRDGNKCLICNSKEDLTVHHIFYHRRKTSLNDCCCLCRGCNGRVNRKDKREYWTLYFRRLIHFNKTNR